jgi:hypothetical protein
MLPKSWGSGAGAVKGPVDVEEEAAGFRPSVSELEKEKGGRRRGPTAV